MVRPVLLIALAAVSLQGPGRAAAQTLDDKTYTFVLFDLAEYRQNGDRNPVSWDVIGWVGGDYTRFWFKSEGDVATLRTDGDVEVQGLYSRLIAPFWEVQAGLRADLRYGGGEERARPGCNRT